MAQQNEVEMEPFEQIWHNLKKTFGCRDEKGAASFPLHILVDAVIGTMILYAILIETNFYEELAYLLTGVMPPSYSSEKLTMCGLWQWMHDSHFFALMICPSIGLALYFTLGDRSMSRGN